MKKLMIIAVAFVALQGVAYAQGPQKLDRKDKMHLMHDLSPEEAATLYTKKMTLHLDLNKSQQDDIYNISLENAKKRKEMMEAYKAKKESGNMEKPSKEERLKMMNAKLDHQIAMKAKMKKILNEEQYAKWEKPLARKKMKSGDKKRDFRKKEHRK
ncbi:hypothetical protein [Tamlana crocina]|uniref:DUF4890 domain-containing protein n=1 Tax=Tamlana crocina TaxID=393006 RepID=A0ABX1DE26_9FLAO|nr:hypothetical protein [Tamlana crocina]NJX16599.1 hypothetical protein [Tamlana crocina]